MRFLTLSLVALALLAGSVTAQAQEGYLFERSLDAWLQRDWAMVQDDLLGAGFARQMHATAAAQAGSSGATLESFRIFPPTFHYLGFGVVDGSIGFEMNLSRRIRIVFLRITARLRLTYQARIRQTLANPFRRGNRITLETRLIGSQARISGRNFLGSLVKFFAGGGIVRQFQTSVDRWFSSGSNLKLVLDLDRGVAARTSTATGPIHRGVLGAVESPFLFPDGKGPATLAHRGFVSYPGRPDPRLSRLNLVFVGDGFGPDDRFVEKVSHCMLEMRKEKPFADFAAYTNVYHVHSPARIVDLDYHVAADGSATYFMDGDRLEQVISSLPPRRQGAQSIVIVLTTRPIRARAFGTTGLIVMGRQEPGRWVEETVGGRTIRRFENPIGRLFLHELSHIVGLLADEYDHSLAERIDRRILARPWFRSAFEALHPNLTTYPGTKWADLARTRPEIGYHPTGISLGPGSPTVYAPSAATLMGADVEPSLDAVGADIVARRLLWHLPIDVTPKARLRVRGATLRGAGHSVASLRAAVHGLAAGQAPAASGGFGFGFRRPPSILGLVAAIEVSFPDVAVAGTTSTVRYISSSVVSMGSGWVPVGGAILRSPFGSSFRPPSLQELGAARSASPLSRGARSWRYSFATTIGGQPLRSSELSVIEVLDRSIDEIEVYE